MKVKSLSRVRLLATPWTAAYQTPPSVGFSRQEYWNGVSLPSLDKKFNRFHSFKQCHFSMQTAGKHIYIYNNAIFVHLMLYRIFNFINWKVSVLCQNQTERG